jgi:ABC-type proline/glycine betaine transport system ATPase subunit
MERCHVRFRDFQAQRSGRVSAPLPAALRAQTPAKGGRLIVAAAFGARRLVRADILDLLVSLQRDEGIAYLFISQDLGVVIRVAHRVAVMEAGAIAETGEARQIIAAPSSGIGKALVAAMPSLAWLALRETE